MMKSSLIDENKAKTKLLQFQQQQNQNKIHNVTYSQHHQLNHQLQQINLNDNQFEREITVNSRQCLSTSSSSTSLQDMEKGFNYYSSSSSTPITINSETQERDASQLVQHANQSLVSISQQSIESNKRRRSSEEDCEYTGNEMNKISRIPGNTHRKRSSSEDWHELLCSLSTNMSPNQGNDGDERSLSTTFTEEKGSLTLLSGEELKEITWGDDMWEEV